MHSILFYWFAVQFSQKQQQVVKKCLKLKQYKKAHVCLFWRLIANSKVETLRGILNESLLVIF